MVAITKKGSEEICEGNIEINNDESYACQV